MTLIKTIDVGGAQPDGIYFDDFNQRVYVFSPPTKDATVIDAKDGAVLPEELPTGPNFRSASRNERRIEKIRSKWVPKAIYFAFSGQGKGDGKRPRASPAEKWQSLLAWD